MRKTVIVATACLCLAPPAWAQAVANVRIGGWALSANGQLARGFQYTGSCPVRLKFDWGVILATQGYVRYRFERSDGGHSSQVSSIRMDHPGQSTPVFDDWTLGANTPQFANYSGWVNLIIEAPMRVEQKINFTIHCR